MRYIFFPLRNIVNLFKKNQLMALIMALSQIISIIVILLAYGMIMNAKRDVNTAIWTQRMLDVYNIGEDKDVKLNEVRAEFEKVFDGLGDSIEKICIVGYDKEQDIDIYMWFKYRNGNYFPDEEGRDSLLDEQPHHTGRYFSNEEFYNGKKVVVTSAQLEKVGEKCVINGQAYEVVGQFFEGGYTRREVSMPYLSADDAMCIMSLSIELDTIPTISQYNYFANKMFGLFDNQCEVGLPQKLSNEMKGMYKTYGMIAGIMLFMSAINIGVIYGYILKVRKKNNAILSLCGGKTHHIVLINLLEMVVICILSYILAHQLFIHLILPQLKDIFTYFNMIFKDYVFMDMFGIYLITVIVAGLYNIVKVLRKQTIHILRE